MIGNYRIEREVLDSLKEKGQVSTYKHTGFWAPVETARDKEQMENLWNAGIAPWKVW